MEDRDTVIRKLVKNYPLPWTEKVVVDPTAPDCYYVHIDDAKGRRVVGIDCDDNGIGELLISLVEQAHISIQKEIGPVKYTREEWQRIEIEEAQKKSMEEYWRAHDRDNAMEAMYGD